MLCIVYKRCCFSMHQLLMIRAFYFGISFSAPAPRGTPDLSFFFSVFWILFVWVLLGAPLDHMSKIETWV